MTAKTLTIPAEWLQKVASATGMELIELEDMVIRMWDRGYSKAEIEHAVSLLARAKGNSIVFTRKGAPN